MVIYFNLLVWPVKELNNWKSKSVRLAGRPRGPVINLNSTDIPDIRSSNIL